jgi:TPR repeat protein
LSLRLVVLAADQGDEAIQLQAGKLYHQGVGTAANFVEAARFFRLAVEMHNDFRDKADAARRVARHIAFARRRVHIHEFDVNKRSYGDGAGL